MSNIHKIKQMFSNASKAANPKRFKLFQHENYSFEKLDKNHKNEAL